jgi:hypothetical protein
MSAGAERPQRTTRWTMESGSISALNWAGAVTIRSPICSATRVLELWADVKATRNARIDSTMLS